MPNPVSNQDRPRDGAVPLEYHPYAGLFPPMEGQPFDDFKADIEKQGLIEPIVIHDGKILDGITRYRACTEAGIEPTFIPYRGDDPLAFVLSANLHRRHLDASQRAMIAAKLETFRHGGDRKSDQDATVHVDRKKAAAALNVSERSVASAAAVREHGAAELVQAVERGDIPVSTAADLAREPVETQREVIARQRDDDGKLTPTVKGRRSQHEIEVERFENAVRIVESTCENAANNNIPAITAAQAKKAAKQLNNAKTSVEKLTQRIEAASQRVPAKKVRKAKKVKLSKRSAEAAAS